MKFLITAGPTREAIDPVRYLSNRSSGRMGFAIAAAAAGAGHGVTLIAGPVQLETPPGVTRIDVISAAEMMSAVEREIGAADVVVMAAAVADFRPARVPKQKIKKADAALVLELDPTADILGGAREKMHFGGVLVGFAAETENLEENARSKLERKGCDLLVANDVGRAGIGFDSEENEVTILSANGGRKVIAKRSKKELAALLVRMIESCAADKMS